ELRAREERIRNQAGDGQGDPHGAPDQEPPPVDRVGDGAAEDRERDQRDELRERDESHGERGAREVVHLHGYGDEQHPPGDERDGLPGPESPEGRRDAERRHVHRRAGEESTDRRWPCDGRHSPTRSTTSVSPSTERTRTVSPTSAVPSHRAAQISPPSFT